MGIFSDLSGWQFLGITLLLTHITIVSVTVFLHRTQAHRAVQLSAGPSHFFRFWLWMTTGMVTREWVAIHRKHHAKCETDEDPHSPQTRGIHTVLWKGALLYRKEAENQETLERFGKNTPDDWLEQNVYSKYPMAGVLAMLALDVALFGWVGILMWAVQMIWIPFWAAGVINGLAHFWGYRNWDTPDASTNISPIGILIGGEELHNNHHAFAISARFSNRWYEFDIGWFYIRLLEMLGLAKVLKVAPRIKVNPDKQVVDLETAKAVLGNRLQVLSNFARQVTTPVIKKELCSSSDDCREKSQLARKLLNSTQQLDNAARASLQQMLEESQVLETVYQYQQRLRQLWERNSGTQEARLKEVQDWVSNAEKTGVEALEQFAQRLRGYSVA
uniref:Fatty acid desaturase ) n=1 Tax=uncultured Thiotrichaceae bacterium TaxID=298394 RepID=A0A6S6SHW6_9GAMM|nr:MAG: Fatty acid desaturase (EC; Delta-9 fatty acid desaturase (EC [uncultured Thiotrichaceae bacterium]